MKNIIPYIIFEKVAIKYIAYHGTKNEFEHFNYAYVGKGLDEYGPGFYFTNDYDEALKYGKVSKYELTIEKYIIKDKKPLRGEVSKLIRWAPEYKDTLTNFGQYEYEAMNTAIKSLTRDGYDKVDSYLSICGDFYRKQGNSALFVKNLVRLKYDAYIVREGDNTKYIMYNIDKIRKLND